LLQRENVAGLDGAGVAVAGHVDADAVAGDEVEAAGADGAGVVG